MGVGSNGLGYYVPWPRLYHSVDLCLAGGEVNRRFWGGGDAAKTISQLGIFRGVLEQRCEIQGRRVKHAEGCGDPSKKNNHYIY